MVSDHSSHNDYESTTDSMPQWLIHDENYHPNSVKNSGLKVRFQKIIVFTR